MPAAVGDIGLLFVLMGGMACYVRYMLPKRSRNCGTCRNGARINAEKIRNAHIGDPDSQALVYCEDCGIYPMPPGKV